MTKKILLTLGLLTTLTAVSFSQNEDGYWDNERATYKEIRLCAGCKTWQRTDEFPVGTTEVVYRITLLDENQQLASNLVSVLGMVPDPSGISQGSAGAIALASKISGSDKCKFTIFSSYQDAQNYLDYGNYQSGCYIHPYDISKVAGRLTMQGSSCLQTNASYMWFGFKSMNMLMGEKIILEAVPWVDKKASRGWSLEVKQKFIDNCKTIDGVDKFSDADQYCQCLLDKFQENYKVQDFQQMTSTEINKVSEKFGKDCLSETGELDNLYDQQRKDASSLANQGRYGEAVAKLLDIVTNSKPTAMDYNNLGYYYLFTKQYLKAIKYLREGEKLDETELLIKGNLAHAYLLNGDTEQAQAIYTKYKTQNVTDNMSWVDMVKSDFDAFTRAGLPTNNFETILSVIK